MMVQCHHTFVQTFSFPLFFFKWMIECNDDDVLHKNWYNKQLERCLVKTVSKQGHIFSQKTNPEEYDSLRFSAYSLISQFPAAIILVNNTVQVSESVKCAQENDINHIRVRSGGHSFEGYSTCNNCLLIDLRLMMRFEVDPANKVITAQPGLMLGHLNYRLWMDDKLAIPTGSCISVGLGGHILGGGKGYLSRKYGMLADNMIELTMVDYRGTVMTANRSSNTDLYWANRGAGGGQFGIITEFKVQGHEIGDGNMTYFYMRWSMSHFTKGFLWFQDIVTMAAPEELGFELIVYVDHQSFMIHGYYLGHKPALIKWMNEVNMYEIGPSKKTEIFELDYASYLLHSDFYPLDNKSILNETTVKPDKSPFKCASAFARQPLSPGTVNQLMQKIQNPPIYKATDMKCFQIIFEAFGGKISELEDTDTAFVHRKDVLFMAQLIVSWKPEVQANEDVELILAWQHEARLILMQDMEGAYANYVDQNLNDYMADYYGENAARLQTVKRLFDPNNVFDFEQSIPVTEKINEN